MARCSYEDLDITIRGNYSPYGVSATYQGMAAEGTIVDDVQSLEWQKLLRGLAESIYTPAPEIIRQAGARLFESLFAGDVRDLWIRACTALDNNQNDGLRIRFAIHPPAVAALPWELLYDSDRNMAFAANSRTPLLRVENLLRQIGPPRPLYTELPLKVLLVAPEDPTGQIDIDHELENIQSLLDAVGRDAITITQLTGRISILDLRRKLESESPDLLHIISHGQPEGILLWHKGKPALVTSAAMRTTLAHTPSVKLVFLNACLAGLGSEEQAFTSVGTQILQTGVPAVIAMQFPIRDDAAIDFAYFLYEELLRSRCPGAIDYAISSARSQLYSLGQGDVSFATPILWQNAPDGIIFNFPAHRPTDKRKPSAPDDYRVISLDDLDAERVWLTALDAEINLSLLPRELQFLAREWQRSVEALHRLLDQLTVLAKDRRSLALADKCAEYKAEKTALLRLHGKINDLSS